MGGDRLALTVIGHHHPAQTGFQVRKVRGQTKHRHDLAGHGDIKAVLPGDPLHPAAEAVDNVAELPVVHIHTALPGDVLYVDIQGVPLLDMVVQQRCQQVIGRPDSVEIPGEVKVDVLHGDDLSPAAAGGTALDAEHRAKRGFPQGKAGLFAQTAQPVGQANAGGGLPLSGRSGVDGGDQNQFSLPGLALIGGGVHLGLIVAVGDQLLRGQAQLGSDLSNGAGGHTLGDLNIGHHERFPLSVVFSLGVHPNIWLYCIIFVRPAQWKTQTKDIRFPEKILWDMRP